MSVFPPTTLSASSIVLIFLGLVHFLIPGVTPAFPQTIGQRGGRLPEPPKPKTLSLRESTFSAIVSNAVATYRKEAGSQTFVQEASEGDSRLEWSIGGEARPVPEGAKAPASVTQKRVKFIPHEGKLFVKIDVVAKGVPGREEEEIRSSGTYEAAMIEGTWAGYQDGGTAKVRIAAPDHIRYLAEFKKALFDEAALAAHADKFRREMIAVLENKLANPGTTPQPEIQMVGQLVAIVKAHPEAFVVIVTPSFEADPEIFVLEGDTMRSSTAKETTTLRFDGKLPALARP